MPTNTLVVGSTYRFKLTATKDTLPWDLALATTTLYLKRPDGVVSSFTATAATSPYYDYEIPAFTGRWSRSWKPSEGAVHVESEGIPFVVVDAP